MANDTYLPGAWNAICDVCGFKFKSTMMRERWDGMMVCHKDWEPRHPLEFIKVPKEEIAPPWVRPDTNP